VPINAGPCWMNCAAAGRAAQRSATQTRRTPTTPPISGFLGNAAPSDQGRLAVRNESKGFMRPPEKSIDCAPQARKRLCLLLADAVEKGRFLLGVSSLVSAN
jgi:hypothetical protein